MERSKYSEEHLKYALSSISLFSVPGRFSVVLLAVDVVVHLPLVVLGLYNEHGRLDERNQVLGKKHASPLVF